MTRHRYTSHLQAAYTVGGWVAVLGEDGAELRFFDETGQARGTARWSKARREILYVRGVPVEVVQRFENHFRRVLS